MNKPGTYIAQRRDYIRRSKRRFAAGDIAALGVSAADTMVLDVGRSRGTS